MAHKANVHHSPVLAVLASSSSKCDPWTPMVSTAQELARKKNNLRPYLKPFKQDTFNKCPGQLCADKKQKHRHWGLFPIIHTLDQKFPPLVFIYAPTRMLPYGDPLLPKLWDKIPLRQIWISNKQQIGQYKCVPNMKCKSNVLPYIFNCNLITGRVSYILCGLSRERSVIFLMTSAHKYSFQSLGTQITPSMKRM